MFYKIENLGQFDKHFTGVIPHWVEVCTKWTSRHAVVTATFAMAVNCDHKIVLHIGPWSLFPSRTTSLTDTTTILIMILPIITLLIMRILITINTDDITYNDFTYKHYL